MIEIIREVFFMNKLLENLNKHYPHAIDLRNYFHQYPELSGKEFNTQTKIIKELTNLGLTCTKAAQTGVVAELNGKYPGKTIAIRADIDALPIQDDCNREYQSKNLGVCHACGHDAHMAILLGTIHTLVDLKDKLQGNFRFIFQPSEEQFPSGAVKIINEGHLNNVDAIIGAHIWQPIPLGTIGISYGNLMAAPDKFKITIHAKGGHGSMPHQTIDPTLIAAQIILALNTIVSRNLDPLELAVVSIGSVHTGNAFNIIPDTAVIEGTVRSFKQSVREIIFKRIEEISNGICLASQANCTLDSLFGHPAVINHPKYAKEIEAVVNQCQSAIKPEIISPVMCAEDFSYYLNKVPGTFFFIGTGTNTVTYPHHHPKFDIDNKAILYGMEVMVKAALQLAQK